jgi:hypothetical protein
MLRATACKPIELQLGHGKNGRRYSGDPAFYPVIQLFVNNFNMFDISSRFAAEVFSKTWVQFRSIGWQGALRKYINSTQKQAVGKR